MKAYRDRKIKELNEKREKKTVPKEHKEKREEKALTSEKESDQKIIRKHEVNRKAAESSVSDSVAQDDSKVYDQDRSSSTKDECQRVEKGCGEQVKTESEVDTNYSGMKICRGNRTPDNLDTKSELCASSNIGICTMNSMNETTASQEDSKKMSPSVKKIVIEKNSVKNGNDDKYDVNLCTESDPIKSCEAQTSVVNTDSPVESNSGSSTDSTSSFIKRQLSLKRKRASNASPLKSRKVDLNVDNEVCDLTKELDEPSQVVVKGIKSCLPVSEVGDDMVKNNNVASDSENILCVSDSEKLISDKSDSQTKFSASSSGSENSMYLDSKPSKRRASYPIVPLFSDSESLYSSSDVLQESRSRRRRSGTPSQLLGNYRCEMKTRGARNQVMLSSVLQFLIDDAKREKDEKDFELPMQQFGKHMVQKLKHVKEGLAGTSGQEQNSGKHDNLTLEETKSVCSNVIEEKTNDSYAKQVGLNCQKKSESKCVEQGQVDTEAAEVPSDVCSENSTSTGTCTQDSQRSDMACELETIRRKSNRGKRRRKGKGGKSKVGASKSNIHSKTQECNNIHIESKETNKDLKKQEMNETKVEAGDPVAPCVDSPTKGEVITDECELDQRESGIREAAVSSSEVYDLLESSPTLFSQGDSQQDSDSCVLLPTEDSEADIIQDHTADDDLVKQTAPQIGKDDMGDDLLHLSSFKVSILCRRCK